MGTFVLTNLATAPIGDDALADGLLAFANGAELTVVGQDAWVPRADPADRPRVIEYLENLVAGEAPLPEIGGRPTLKVIRIRGNAPAWLASSLLAGLLHIYVEPVLVAGPKGYMRRYFRQFPSGATLLAEAAALFLDLDRRESLSRCLLCSDFYIARKNPRGGPANKTYCSPEHRRVHNNSSKRKKA